jgi:Family of unknown function (DUF6151)
MNHPLRCRCETLKGYVSHPEKVSRGVCYCKDCQAYAHFLGKTGDILDEMGGTDVVATLPEYVAFTQGFEALACMSLTARRSLPRAMEPRSQRQRCSRAVSESC